MRGILEAWVTELWSGEHPNSNRNPTVYGQGTEKMDPCGPERVRASSFFFSFSSFLFSPVFVLKPVLVTDLYCCDDNVAGSAGTWTLFLWLVELGKRIPVCKECRRSLHYIFFSLLPLKGGSSDTELYDSVLVVCGGGSVDESLRKIYFSGQTNWETRTLWARDCGENPREKRAGQGNPSNSVYELTQVLGPSPSCTWEAQTQKIQSKISGNWAII